MDQVTVRVELDAYALLGREVEALEVTQAVGDHARCTFAFDRDPRSARPIAGVTLADLAGAPVRVVFLDAAGEGAAAAGGCLAFEGRVREARVAHQAGGGGRFTVTAVSDSHALAAHADRRYLTEQTLPALAAALGASVAGGGTAGAVPGGAPRDYVQRGESAWAFLARVAAGEGLQLRAAWGRSPDDAPPPAPAELGAGFAPVAHALTWGRDLLELVTALRPTNPGVTGAFYDPGAKHDHRFRGVRQKAAWLGGAQPVVAAAERVATSDADGGDPGHVEVGGPGGARARTLEEFRARLERASAARAGQAVEATGVSTQPALRAGDCVQVQDGAPGAPDGADAPGLSPWGADVGAAERGGTYGLVAVAHHWGDGLYTNHFTATPWADYHPTPAQVERRLAAAAAVDGGGDAAGSDGAGPGGGGTTGGLALGVVVANADPKHRGRVKVRYAWMDEAEASAWVRVVGLGGGNGRGVGVLPSVGDEVVVAAVAGDPEHPVVLGGLWNGVDAAGHAPGRQHWVTPAGNTLSFSEGKAGADEEKVELHSKGGTTWVQLAQKGPTGVPTVTVHSEGDLALEAPKGELRITAKRMATFVETDARREVKGAVVDVVTGPVTVASQGRLALKGGPEVAVVADGTLHAHAGGAQTLTGAPVTLNPAGATAPRVDAQAPARQPSAWGARPVPGPGPGRSTRDPSTPTKRELAARAQRASVAADQSTVPTGQDVASSTREGVNPGGGMLQFASYRPPASSPLGEARSTLAKVRDVSQCKGAWDDVGKAAEGVLAQGRDPATERVDVIRRNTAITAAYAKLYQADERLRWAGVAAFASKQVGCGLRDARGIARAPDSVLERMPPISIPIAAGQTALQGRRAAAQHMEDALARGNEAVFRDIYPVHRFYADNGLAALRLCGSSRPGGSVPPQVMRAFGELDGEGHEPSEGDLRTAAQRVLRHEQRVTLQEAVYNDPVTVGLLVGNQAAVKVGEATRGIGGDKLVRAAGARPVEVAFTSECEGSPSERFNGLNLADFDQRWPYAQRVANRFHDMAQGEGRGQLKRDLANLAGRAGR